MPAPPFAGTTPRLNLNPQFPTWASAPLASGSETIPASGAQIRLWSPAAAAVVLASAPAATALRKQLNPNPQYPFWVGQGIPRANPPASASVDQPLSAPSGQLLIQGAPGAIAGVSATPQSGQVRVQGSAPAITGTANESGSSAQLRFWSTAAVTVQPVSSAPLRKRLNPNPQFPFWPGAPRANPPQAAANVTLNTPSAQLLLQAQTSAVLTTVSAITPSSGQLRLWSQITASAQLAAPSAQLRLRSRVTSVSGTATVNAATAQIRTRGTTATVSGSASVPARSAQIRVQAVPAAHVGSANVVNSPGQVRLWSSSGGTIVGAVTQVNAPAAQVRFTATSATVLTGTVIVGATSQLLIRGRTASVTGTASQTGSAAQVRFWSTGAAHLTLGTSIRVDAPTSQIRLRVGIPLVAASTTVQGIAAQFRTGSYGIQVSIPSTSASVTASAAQIRLVAGTPVLRRGRANVSLMDARTTAVLLTDAI